MNTSKHYSALNRRKVRLLLERDLRAKYIADQIRIGLRNQLRAIREERGMTQVELANLIGTKQSVISRIERDPIRVGLPVFLDIAEKLDIGFVARFESIDTVVEWYDSPTVKKMTPRKSEEVLKDRAKELLTSSSTSATSFLAGTVVTTAGMELSKYETALPTGADRFRLYYEKYIPISGHESRATIEHRRVDATMSSIMELFDVDVQEPQVEHGSKMKYDRYFEPTHMQQENYVN